MNFGGTAQTKRTQMVDRMALRFSKTDPGKCKFEGEGANRVGKYVVTGTGAFRDGGWDLECERVYTPNAPALPPAPAAGKRAKANPLAFAGALRAGAAFFTIVFLGAAAFAGAAGFAEALGGIGAVSLRSSRTRPSRAPPPR